jgi:quercetin dioxygenase-like cupin family protein
MRRRFLQLTKAPEVRSKAALRLQSTGLALDYFPSYTQKNHDFHTHHFIEILFVLSGTFRHVTADRTYDESAVQTFRTERSQPLSAV